MRDEPIETEELRRAKDHLKGATLLALEGSGARMSNLARYHIYFDRHFTPQELIAMLEAVTAEEVQQIARSFSSPAASPPASSATSTAFSSPGNNSRFKRG